MTIKTKPVEFIDGTILRNMIIAGANALEQNRDIIDALNVFPVPDGDTGTNMSMTTLVAAKEVEAISSKSVHAVAKAASGGSLRGARGNSGVILSQLFRGFAKGLEGCETATAEDLAYALRQAVETAYKAVMKPKEGTILTVAKAMADKAEKTALDTDDIVHFTGEVIKTGREMLKQTTEMLPALKQANVVDAGGQGLLCIFEGAYGVLTGKNEGVTVEAKLPDKDKIDYTAFSKMHEEDIEFAYCTEFFINTDNDVTEAVENPLKTYLDTIGDSIVVVGDGKIIKVHVHTNNPGTVLEKALTMGSLSTIKIENMRIQHTEKVSFLNDSANKKADWKPVGFVAVSVGAGLKAIFENLGADEVIEGGQTMNPSADDILKAIEKVKAHDVFVLPNNKNIVLAAQQAATLSEDRNVVVLPSKSIPQGITALVGYSSVSSVEENVKSMTEMMEFVHCGQITYAVRNTTLGGHEIGEGDILCMYDGDIALVEKDIENGAKNLVDHMMADGGEIMTIYYGADITESDADKIRAYAEEKYPDCEVEIQNGEQPLYYYIISVE